MGDNTDGGRGHDPDERDLGPPMELLRVSKVAAMLRVSKMTIYRLIRAGQLQAIRVGESLRLPRAAVQAFLREAR
jgi:excisionase family DNA binding protein